MLNRLGSETNLGNESIASTKILESQGQYRSCHIRVPDLDRPVAAILVDGEFYSFFKAVKDAEKVIVIAAKLGNSGDRTVITKNSKAYIIWVREPEGVSTITS